MHAPRHLIGVFSLVAALLGGNPGVAAAPLRPSLPPWSSAPAVDRCAPTTEATGSPTRRLAEQALGSPGTAAWLPQVRVRCRFACRCYYVNRTKRSCEQTLVLDCAGRLCSACVERAKAQARRSCRARGAVRRCGCPFRRLGVKP